MGILVNSIFWWEMEKGKKKSWDSLCRPKCFGGLGFRKLSIFNKALLAKQLWRIIRNPASMVSQILKARYFKHVDVMEATLGSKPSFIWRSLIWSRDLLNKGLCWRVGNGKQIKVQKDRWAFLPPQFIKRSILVQSGGNFFGH